MGTTILLRHTEARYRGQHVTVLGVPSAGLLAVTGYGSERPRLVGLITVVERDGQRAYRVDGHVEELQEIDAAAAALVEQRS